MRNWLNIASWDTTGMRLKFQSLIGIPGPRDIGMSKSNALGMRSITPFQEGPTWEDWHERIKAEYPVRYKLNEAFGVITQRLYSIQMDYFAFKSFLAREHMVDLRGADPLVNKYRYGYVPPSEAMKLASWKLLMQWVEDHTLEDPSELDIPEEQREEPWYKQSIHTYNEAKELYRYWTVIRRRQREELAKIGNAKRAAGVAKDEATHKELMSKFQAQYEKMDVDEQEMFIRLAKLRPFLE